MATLFHRNCGGFIGYNKPVLYCSKCGNLRQLRGQDRHDEQSDSIDWLIPYLLSNQLIEMEVLSGGFEQPATEPNPVGAGGEFGGAGATVDVPFQVADDPAAQVPSVEETPTVEGDVQLDVAPEDTEAP